MRILCCCPLEYYGRPGTRSEVFGYFVTTLRDLGHTVHHFDQVRGAADQEAMNEFFVSVVRRGGYEAVLVITNDTEFLPEALDEAMQHSVTIAWNSDDDVRWDSYSAPLYSHFAKTVTTCESVFEANRHSHPNLILSQWACTGRYDGFSVQKDIDIAFVGQSYRGRDDYVRRLTKDRGMMVYGSAASARRQTAVDRLLRRSPQVVGQSSGPHVLSDEGDVKAIWNRAKVSFTPLSAWEPGVLQVKARVFDMGLSGTVMLCDRNPRLYEFYEPEKEFLDFGSYDECLAKADFLLRNERERQRIALAYRRRTIADHMWKHRFEVLFRHCGLGT